MVTDVPHPASFLFSAGAACAPLKSDDAAKAARPAFATALNMLPTFPQIPQLDWSSEGRCKTGSRISSATQHRL